MDEVQGVEVFNVVFLNLKCVAHVLFFGSFGQGALKRVFLAYDFIGVHNSEMLIRCKIIRVGAAHIVSIS